jgi:hypothetical protein
MSATGRPVFRSRRPYCLLAAALCAAVLISQPSHAEKRSGAMLPNKPALGPAGERLNANTIAIISGNLNATCMTIAYDLSAVLDDGKRLAGRRVNFSDLGSGTQLSTRDIFERGIKAEELNMDQINAPEKLKSGEIAATNCSGSS